MAEDAPKGNVSIGMAGGTLQVDARPATLVAVLSVEGQRPRAVAMAGNTTVSSAVPEDAKGLSVRVTDDVSIEASPASTFVALGGDTGRVVVSALSGEVVVRPLGGDGERFALTAHDVLIAPHGATADAIVVAPAAEVSEADRTEIDRLTTQAARALRTAGPAPTPAAEPAPTAPAAPDDKSAAGDKAERDKAADDKAAGDKAAAGTKAEGAAPTGATTAAAPGKAKPEVARAADAPPRKGKGKTKAERKRERSEAARKRAEDREKRAAAAAAAAGAGAAASGAEAAKAGAAPGGRQKPQKKAKPATAARAGKGEAKPAMTAPTKVPQASSTAGPGGRGTGPRSSVRPKKLTEAEEDRRERKALPIMLLGGAVIALAVLFFASRGDDGADVGVAGPTTEAPTTEAPTTEAPTTQAPTTAAPTTTAAPQPSYSFIPKSCQQDGQRITYTAEVTNKAEQAYRFVVQVVFKDSSGATVAETTSRIDRLETGRTATLTATGTSDRNLAGSGASCNVEKVDATPA